MNAEAVSHWAVPTLLGAGLAGLGLLVVVLAVRIAPVPSTVPHSASSAFTLTSGKQSSHLFDLEPLFLPTKYNTSTLPLPFGSGREPGSIAKDFPAKLTISESSGGVSFPEAVAVPDRLVEALSYGELSNPWPEVGRADLPVLTVKPRVAFIEVTAAKTGQPIFSLEVPNTAETTVPSSDWAPLEFLIAVDAAGLVGAPVITGSTTTEEVESFFRTVVARTFHFGARLTPGFYTVRIGP